MITILSNGSKWAGEKPDGLDLLETRLREYPLDNLRFKDCGNFAYKRAGVYYLFGNFRTLSAGFNIEMGEEDRKTFEHFRRLIRANQKKFNKEVIQNGTSNDTD